MPFTENVARVFRLDCKGRLAPEMDADLILLDEHNRPRDVMVRGKWHKRRGEPVVTGAFETQA